MRQFTDERDWEWQSVRARAPEFEGSAASGDHMTPPGLPVEARSSTQMGAIGPWQGWHDVGSRKCSRLLTVCNARILLKSMRLCACPLPRNRTADIFELYWFFEQ
jgi:hypothetical protein